MKRPQWEQEDSSQLIEYDVLKHLAEIGNLCLSNVDKIEKILYREIVGRDSQIHAALNKISFFTELALQWQNKCTSQSSVTPPSLTFLFRMVSLTKQFLDNFRQKMTAILEWQMSRVDGPFKPISFVNSLEIIKDVSNTTNPKTILPVYNTSTWMIGHSYMTGLWHLDKRSFQEVLELTDNSIPLLNELIVYLGGMIQNKVAINIHSKIVTIIKNVIFG